MYNDVMNDKHILQRGQPPISDKYADKTKSFNFIIPLYQFEYLQKRSNDVGLSNAEYLRRLIEADMAQNHQTNND